MAFVEPAHSIARLGFRRWYERQLFESFAWLTTCILSGVVFAATIEFVGFGSPGYTLLTLTVLYFIGLMGFTAWRTFWRKLMAAQDYAGSAVCAGCGAYGMLEVLRESSPVPVRCRRCGHQWRLAGAREDENGDQDDEA